MSDDDSKKRSFDDEKSFLLNNGNKHSQTDGSFGSINQEPQKRPFFLFDPSRAVFRFSILFFVCFLTFGSYFVYDNPAALIDQIKDRFDADNFQFLALYSVYSWPNTVQVFFGGWLLDSFFGLRLGALVFCSFVMVGQIIFAVGVSIGKLPGWIIALGGRFVFGMGGESLSVAQSTYTSKWFRGKELAMAFGIALSFSRLGSAINFNVLPYIDDFFGLSIAIWVGAGICIVSIVRALVLAFLDLRGEKAAAQSAPELTEKVQAEEKVSLLDVRYFPLSIWLIFGICVSFYVSVFVFISLASEFLQDNWNMSSTEAGHLVSIPYFFSAGASPFLGFIVDKVGRAGYWIVTACGVMTVVHLSFVIYPLNYSPIPPLVVMGASYSVLAAALWPSVALLVDVKILGTAFGLMTALQNLGLAVAPLVIGAITSKWSTSVAVYCFAGCAGTATILAVLLIFADLRENKILNSSAKVIKARLAELREKTDEHITPESLGYEEEYEAPSPVFG